MEHRILLTGSNGLLGQKIVNLLRDRQHTQLWASARGTNRHPIRGGYTYVEADLTDYSRWKDIFADFKPTTLIHTAAMTQVDQCETDHSLCDAINVTAVEQLTSLCARYGTHMVHISTDFVFDGSAGPYRETDAPAPVNYYGGAKLKAEQIIQASNPDHAILRTMLLYGVTPAMSRSNIVLWARDSLMKGKEIRVVTDQVRCPTLAEDLAQATVTAAMREARGLYHISGSEMMPIIDLARKVADFWDLDASLIHEVDSPSLNQPARRPPVTGFILLKAQTELGYQPHTLDQGLALVDRQLQALEA
ncbi:MAG: SDR family oxidoreductase [Bacteroidetes bacterium]|nr:MAG: SDR family oxidoreductase [Bacteroidota bacterium]